MSCCGCPASLLLIVPHHGAGAARTRGHPALPRSGTARAGFSAEQCPEDGVTRLRSRLPREFGGGPQCDAPAGEHRTNRGTHQPAEDSNGHNETRPGTMIARSIQNRIAASPALENLAQDADRQRTSHDVAHCRSRERVQFGAALQHERGTRDPSSAQSGKPADDPNGTRYVQGVV